MTKELDDELVNILKNDPMKLTSWLMGQFGKMCVESNGSAKIKQDHIIDGIRYEIVAKVTAKRVKSK